MLSQEPEHFPQQSQFVHQQSHQPFSSVKFKWNTNREIANILYAVAQHPEWISNRIIDLAPSGSQFIFPRGDGIWFKADSYEWKRRVGKGLIREDHMKLKIEKQEVLTATYVHSAVVPTFHRRCYWLTNNPNVVFVHYLNTCDRRKDMPTIIESIRSTLQSHGLTPSYQQLYSQILPIYNGLLNERDVASLCDTILNNGDEQRSCVAHDQHPCSSRSHLELERRNSCSSACRKGLSSVALQRQPSAFSDSVDPSFAGVSNFGEEQLRGRLLYRHQDTMSHSGETHRSSNPEDDMSLVQATSVSGRSTSAGTNSHISGQLDLSSLPEIVEIVPNKSDLKGGHRVILIGDWYMKGHGYSVMVGEKKAAARLVRPGVLAFNIPSSHAPGEVFVRVLCNDAPASQNIKFIYEGNSKEYLFHALIDRLQIISHAFGAAEILKQMDSVPQDEIGTLNFLKSLQYNRLVNPFLLDKLPNLPSRTIFHIVAALDFPKVLDFLLQWRRSISHCREFDPSSRDSEGDTPLHYAAKFGCVLCARLLVEHRPSLCDILNDRGKTPLDLATEDVINSLQTDESKTRIVSENGSGHTTSTALWVMTNGERVTDDQYMRERSQRTTEEDSVSTMSDNGQDHTETTASRDHGHLHVEISMDTDVHLPDSPKMADLFQAATSPGIELNHNTRQKMASLAKHIIDALPERIKGNSSTQSLLFDEDITPSNVFFGSNFSQMQSADEFWSPQYQDGSLVNNSDVSCQWGFDQQMMMCPSTNSLSFMGLAGVSAIDSSSLDFNKDLGDFFSSGVENEVDPLVQQRLGDLKLSDDEQRELYQAAMVIQRAYREYRERSTFRRQADVERRAAITIQCCYRRYKQFCYFKKLHSAAIVVQKHFRLKKVNQKEPIAAAQVQEHPTMEGQILRIQVPQASSNLSRENRAAITIQAAYRGHRKRQAAARKIQKFMKESRLNYIPPNINIMEHSSLITQTSGGSKRRRYVFNPNGRNNVWHYPTQPPGFHPSPAIYPSNWEMSQTTFQPTSQ